MVTTKQDLRRYTTFFFLGCILLVPLGFPTLSLPLLWLFPVLPLANTIPAVGHVDPDTNVLLPCLFLLSADPPLCDPLSRDPSGISPRPRYAAG